MFLSGKNILIGITGGIAAYKIYELIRKLTKEGANVRVVLTPSALEFEDPKVGVGVGVCERKGQAYLRV